MTVINPNSISGITSITLPSGDSNVLTVHTNDGVERFRIDSSGNVKVGSAATISPDGDLFVTGVCTATTLSGAASGLTGTLPAISGANLTNLTAGNLTGDLPAISGANLTGIAATDNVRTGILDVAGVSTFRNTMNVGAAVTISESGIEASGIGITCANINGAQIGGRRNIIINGAMTVAQRGTSDTTVGVKCVDRMNQQYGGENEAPTFSQADVSSGTTPYTEGFRKAFKITNGDQTSGAGASDYLYFQTILEAQDIANSGWNYLSTSSFITISFWVRSSVAQNFYGILSTVDGTSQAYVYETGSLSANTWTKITKTLPGNSNLQFDNNADAGLYWAPIRAFDGTSRTGSMTLNAWAAYSSSARTPDQTSTWWTTNDATLEVTGLQLEVGQQATPFEHRSFGEELKLCQRYCAVYQGSAAPLGSGGAVTMSGSDGFIAYGHAVNGANPILTQIFPVVMRSTPSQSESSDGHFQFWRGWTTTLAATSITAESSGSSPMHYRFNIGTSGGMSNGDSGIFNFANTSGYLIYDAEL